MPGYSGKSLKEKLGLKDGQTARFINPPGDYFEALGEIDIVRVEADQPADFIHAFYKSKTDLAGDAAKLERSLAPKGMLWVSWPKKSSGVKCDILEQDLRDILLPTGLVDVKIAAITEIWSGLKFVRRTMRTK